jgi:hypothetical protein
MISSLFLAFALSSGGALSAPPPEETIMSNPYTRCLNGCQDLADELFCVKWWLGIWSFIEECDDLGWIDFYLICARGCEGMQGDPTSLNEPPVV